MLAGPLQVVGRIVAALESLRIRYVIGGSLASSLHGIPRATLDVDLVAELRSWHATPLARALEGDFYVDAEMIADAVARTSSFNVIYLPTMFKADVFVCKPDAWWEIEMERGRVENIGIGEQTLRLRVATAEDTLLYKLVWFRLGGEVADRQWQDARGIADIKGDALDRPYLVRWAQHLAVDDLLDRLLGPSPAR